MSNGNPVQFIRDENSRRGQRAYNRVQLEDGNATLYSNTNPVPVDIIDPATGDPLSIDEITGALVTIDVVHHEIHEGELFSVSYKAPDASPIADNGTIIFAITTGAKFCHLIGSGACGGDAQLELVEDATFTGGTAMTERNRKRTEGDGGNTAQVTRDPGAIPVAGNVLEDLFLPGGTGGNAVGIEGGNRVEWILKPNAIYLLRLTNRAGNAQPASLRAEWYEESDN